MDNNDLVKALMELRRRGVQTGNQSSAEEIAGVTGGYFNQAQDRALQSRALNFQEKHGANVLNQERWRTQKMIDAADASTRNQMWNNLIKTGGALALYKYFM